MEQTVTLPAAVDMDKISQLLALSSDMAVEVAGAPFRGSADDLPIIQQIIDSEFINADSTIALQSLGMSLGQVLAGENSDYDWWIVEDEAGRDPCLRYKHSNLLVFPQTILSKRVEQGEVVDVTALYHNLVQQLQQVVEQQLSL